VPQGPRIPPSIDASSSRTEILQVDNLQVNGGIKLNNGKVYLSSFGSSLNITTQQGVIVIGNLEPPLLEPNQSSVITVNDPSGEILTGDAVVFVTVQTWASNTVPPTPPAVAPVVQVSNTQPGVFTLYISNIDSTFPIGLLNVAYIVFAF